MFCWNKSNFFPFSINLGVFIQMRQRQKVFCLLTHFVHNSYIELFFFRNVQIATNFKIKMTENPHKTEIYILFKRLRRHCWLSDKFFTDWLLSFGSHRKKNFFLGTSVFPFYAHTIFPAHKTSHLFFELNSLCKAAFMRINAHFFD